MEGRMEMRTNLYALARLYDLHAYPTLGIDSQMDRLGV